MIRKILKVVLFLFAALLLVLLGLYLIPPKQQVIEYNYVDIETNPEINSKVGWYTADNGKNYQLSWGANQGLQLNYFDNKRADLKHFVLTQIRDNEYDTNEDLQTTEVKFINNPTDSSLTMDVKTSKTLFKARKRSSLFYKQEEIQYFNGDIPLAGLLLTPIENSKSTAIVFIHGSGISDRDNFWYMHQADFLARSGYIVLLPDKRGCGKSGGEWHTASFKDFAEDIQAALDYLFANKESEFSKTGIIGLSQGGWISHKVNQVNSHLDFVIDVVSSATTPNEQVKFEVMRDIMDSGVPKFLADPLSLVFAKRARAKRKIWWEKNGEFDPVGLMSQTAIPVLKIFGDQDTNVPVKRSLEQMEVLLSERPGLPIELKIFEGSGHALFDEETQWIRKDYLEYLDAWISGL